MYLLSFDRDRYVVYVVVDIILFLEKLLNVRKNENPRRFLIKAG